MTADEAFDKMEEANRPLCEGAWKAKTKPSGGKGSTQYTALYVNEDRKKEDEQIKFHFWLSQTWHWLAELR